MKGEVKGKLPKKSNFVILKGAISGNKEFSYAFLFLA
jgi:hypothetical protein